MHDGGASSESMTRAPSSRGRPAPWRARTVLALVLALSLLAAACGSDDSDSGGTAAADVVGTGQGAGTGQDDVSTSSGAEEPVTGGELNTTLMALVGLDPTKLTNGSGGLGFSEFSAIYDTIVRWNNDTGEFEWRTGEFTANEDSTVWTLAIKPDITFQDGTPYDAAAVVAHIERFLSPEGTGGSKPMLIASVASTQVVDPLTVEFTLNEPWVGFPTLFTKELGMVPSPSQVAAQGADFGINPGPAGAGPFEFVSYTPGQELVVKRNESYYGEPAYLDQITFTRIGGGDPAITLEALKNGDIDVMYTRDYPAIDMAESEDDLYFAGFTTIPGNGNVLFNSFNVPTKVRLASQYAINPEVINERVYQGLRPPSSEVFDRDFPYHPDVPGIPYDPEQAEQLFQEARDEGWSGSIRVLGTNLKEPSDLVQVVVAMLEAAGADAEPVLVEPAQLGQLVSIQKDFDAVVNFSYEMSTNPAETYNQLYKSFNATTPRFGYTSPDMVDGLRQLAVATDQDEYVAAFEKIAETWNRDMPSLVFGNSVAAYIAHERVRGLELSTSEAGMMGGVWLQGQ